MIGARQIAVVAHTRPAAQNFEECLARIDASNTSMGAIVFLDREAMLDAARASAKRRRANELLSPIDGMPIAIKANIAVRGWPWTAGIAAYADRRATQDAPCVARLRAAGAILIGLTNMDEGALGALTDNHWTGRTHNPWRHGFTAGGSSGGSAAAVAAGFCTAALGTDTIGSIRIPASYCGVVGHKSPRGLLPVEGVVPLSPTLDHVGVLAGSAATCRLVTDVAGGRARQAPVPLAGRSLAVPAWREIAQVDADIGDAFDDMARSAADAGARIMPLPADIFPFGRVQRLLLTIAEVEAAVVHRAAMREAPHGFSPGFTALLEWGANAGADRYAAACRDVAAITAATRTALADIDAILLPTTPQTAFAFDAVVPRDQAIFATLASCIGDPATAFPIGLSRAGLPMSAQVVARDEALCLTIAEALTISVAPPRPTHSSIPR